jgi:hypothetical protein
MQANPQDSIVVRRQGRFSVPGPWLFCTINTIVSLAFVFLLVLCPPVRVIGQTTSSLLVQPPTTDEFPLLSVQIKPPTTLDIEGGPLSQDQIQVYENERQVDVLSLEKTRIGVHFTLAINGSTFFDLNDENGVSPYDRILAVLGGWASTREFDEADSWSLVTNESLNIRNSASPEAWRRSLMNYEPNFRVVIPDLGSLSSAIEAARDRVVPFGVDKSILYITTAPSPEQIEAVNALSVEAQLAGIQVNVWMVAEDLFLANDQGAALINLAQNSGGSFFNYTGTESLPNPETYLSSIGSFYTLTYETQIRETGSYPLRVQINTPQGDITGESIPFYLEVEPPNPILLTPPETIERRSGQGTENGTQNLFPDLADINILIEFPDDHPREIRASRLIVDGQVVQQKDQAPFDTLTWDISSLTESGEVRLQVEVIDSLGLSGRTIETPVQIVLIEPDPESTALMDGPWIIVIVIGASLILAFGLFRLWTSEWGKKVLKFFHKDKQEHTSQLDQDAQSGSDSFYRGDANLHPLSLETSFDLTQRIPIAKSTLIIGSDPEAVDILLNDLSIAGTHVQLQYDQGRYWIKILDSTRGTWVNYKLLGRDPWQIKPGDIIHIGDLGFRFTIINAEQEPEVSVSKYKPNL